MAGRKRGTLAPGAYTVQTIGVDARPGRVTMTFRVIGKAARSPLAPPLHRVRGRDPIANGYRMKGVNRHVKQHGWYVRVVFRCEAYLRWFGDAAYGGADSALEAAVEWRDAKEREIGKPLTARKLRGCDSRCQTGVMGVQRREASTWSGRAAYVVTWQPALDVTKSATFSIDDYGEEGAFRLACEFRHEREREVYSGALTPFPTPCTHLHTRRRRGRPPRHAL